MSKYPPYNKCHIAHLKFRVRGMECNSVVEHLPTFPEFSLQKDIHAHMHTHTHIIHTGEHNTSDHCFQRGDVLKSP
jgi:hypothetical protein